MKLKITLLLLLTLIAVGRISAKTTFSLTSFAPYDNTNGSWDSSTLTFTASADWGGGQIWSETDWSSYGILVIKVTSAAAPFQINLESYTSSTKDAHTTVTQNIPASNKAQTFVITLDENKARFYKFEMKLNSSLSDAGGASSYAIVISEAYLLAGSETEDIQLWSGSQNTDNWANKGVDLGYSEKGELANIRMNDKIRITYSNAGEDPKVRVANPNGWGAFEAASEETATTGDNQTFEYTIASAAILEKIQQDGILARGKNITITKVELLVAANHYDAVPLTIGSDGICTFGSTKNLDFSSFRGQAVPYYVSATTNGSVTLESVTTTRAWAGYIVRGTEGTYNIPVSATEPDWNDAFNNLRYTSDYDGNWVYRSAYSDYSGGGDNETKIKTYYRYIFAKNSNSQIGFYKLATDYSRVTTEKEGDNESGTIVYYHILNRHKAYLETATDITPSSNQGAPVLLLFDDNNTTAINAVQERVKEDGVYYNLSGQRVQNPTRGLYIVNGKKYIKH